MADLHDVSIGTAHTILCKELNKKKVHARWLPRLLKETEKARRVADSRAFLRRVDREGDRFLSRIITTDKTWLWLHDPETRSMSAVWKRAASPPPKKARVSRSGRKFMSVMFADQNGMLLQHAVPKDQTVNAEYFSKVLRRDLTRAPRKKRPGVPLEEFILYMDNASSHTAEVTTLDLAVLGFSTIQHPPYSPDLAPFDFFISPTIKAQLKGTRFDSLQELRTATSRITQQYDASWYHDIFRQWTERHQKCIQHRENISKKSDALY